VLEVNGDECEASRVDATTVPVQSPKAPAPKTTVSPGFVKSAPAQTGAALAGVVNTAKTTINPIAKYWSLRLLDCFIEFFLLTKQDVVTTYHQAQPNKFAAGLSIIFKPTKRLLRDDNEMKQRRPLRL
jgi:hypothetical protein